MQQGRRGQDRVVERERLEELMEEVFVSSRAPRSICPRRDSLNIKDQLHGHITEHNDNDADD